MVAELPLTFNRNFQSLLVTVPGSTRPHREHSAFFNSQDSLAVEINGQPRMANNTLIEGLDNNHKTGLLQVIIPAADALETVSVSTSNYDAEFGRSGGAVTNVTIKSGTNDLKGSAFFFGNTDATNASDYFTHLKAPTKFANGGFTLGGPIVRNKLFFFGDYQRTIDNFGYVVRGIVPTVRMRNGDFGEVATRIYDPLDRRRHRRQPRGVCQQSDPAGSNQPNRAATAGAHPGAEHRRRATRAEQLPEGADAREDDRRVRRQGQLLDEREGPDVVPPELHATGGFRSRRSSAQYGGFANGGFAGTGTNTSYSSAATWTRVFSAKTVLDVRGGLNYYHNVTTTEGDGLTTSTELGIPGANIDDYTSGISQIAIANHATGAANNPTRSSASRPASRGIGRRRRGTSRRR